jgi:hypothetical protein
MTPPLDLRRCHCAPCSSYSILFCSAQSNSVSLHCSTLLNSIFGLVMSDQPPTTPFGQGAILATLLIVWLGTTKAEYYGLVCNNVRGLREFSVYPHSSNSPPPTFSSTSILETASTTGATLLVCLGLFPTAFTGIEGNFGRLSESLSRQDS